MIEMRRIEEPTDDGDDLELVDDEGNRVTFTWAELVDALPSILRLTQ